MGIKITPKAGTKIKFGGNELAECFAIIDLDTKMATDKRQKIEITYFQSETAWELNQKPFPFPPTFERGEDGK